MHKACRYIRLGVRAVRFNQPLQKDRGEKQKLAVLGEIYRVTNNYLKQLNVEYWITLGTLLGYSRENDLIPHDEDVDFGLHENDYEKVLSGADMLPPGFRLFNTTFDHRGPKLYIEHKGWEADLYFYEDDNVNLRSYIKSDEGGESKPFPKNLIYPLQKTEFLGEETWIPANPQAFLEHLYGYIGADAEKDPITGYWHKKN